MEQSDDSKQERVRRELEKMYGRGVTPQSLFGFGVAMSQEPTRSQQKTIDAMLAAEDAMREAEEGIDDPSERAMWEAGRSTRLRRKKK